MSYLALARKWRPRFFRDVAGQDHVVRALLNGLESGRLHHAFLLTGTRGVGKTTIARLLAKVLNCDNPAVGEPCGECSACVSIDDGRFVDLLEVDAASNTKVDQTRELLENVQYTPGSGRYKIYLIDEVHMLSASSFNALLKTLEEPPPHVKFILATTDPQKIPGTVLSRCLQFNLKRLPSRLIAERMTAICKDEGIEFEPAAMLRLGRAADGSVRDGLSLLDQALVFGGGTVRDADVAEMLGSSDAAATAETLRLVIAADATGLIRQVHELHEYAPSFESLLLDLARLLQQIAVVQMAGPAALDEDQETDMVESLAGDLDAETTQLFYQIAITGARDLPMAPDPLTGFEMALLRMVAFAPEAPSASAVGERSNAAQPPQQRRSKATKARRGRVKSSAQPAKQSWTDILERLNLSGAALEVARRCELKSMTASQIELRLSQANEKLLSDAQRARIVAALQATYGAQLQVSFEVVNAQVESAADAAQRSRSELDNRARDGIRNDPNIQAMIQEFGATIDEESVKPLRRNARS